MSLIITFSEIFRALLNHPELDFDEKTALEEAKKLVSIFGLEGYAVDNTLCTHERQLLEAYQNFGIVKSYRKEISLGKKTKPWTIFYWILNAEYIKYLTNNQLREKQTRRDIYSIVPEALWD